MSAGWWSLQWTWWWSRGLRNLLRMQITLQKFRVRGQFYFYFFTIWFLRNDNKNDWTSSRVLTVILYYISLLEVEQVITALSRLYCSRYPDSIRSYNRGRRHEDKRDTTRVQNSKTEEQGFWWTMLFISNLFAEAVHGDHLSAPLDQGRVVCARLLLKRRTLFYSAVEIIDINSTAE